MDLAPAQKHKLQAKNNEVIQAFDRARQKMYKCYERAKDSLHDLDKGITYDEFYRWLDKATDARDAYLKDKLSRRFSAHIRYTRRSILCLSLGRILKLNKPI